MTPKRKLEIRNPKSETRSSIPALLFSLRFFTFAFCLLPLTFLCGCQPQVELLTPCPGKASVTAAIDGLNARTNNALPLKASGRCTIEFHDEDGKRRRESFPAIIRTMPPNGLYFQGNLIIPKGIVLGTSDEEFWLWIKLKEVDSFWSGPNAGCVSTALIVSPASILESLGYVSLAPENSGGYSFMHKPPYDVVTVRDDKGRVAKRLWFYTCDSSPRKIEYFDPDGKPGLVATLSHYATVSGEFAVPTQIELAAYRHPGQPERISIKLNKDTLAVFEPTARQAEVLFTKPDPAGVGHIFRLDNNCRFEEER
jgi:hypothetical protein